MNHEGANNYNEGIIGIIIGFFVGIFKNLTFYGKDFFNHLLEITLVTFYTAFLGACISFFVHFILGKLFKKKNENN